MKDRWQKGFTLAEMLIVIAIIILVLFILIMMNWKGQTDRGYDAKRKSDLQNISIALEDYYNDASCFPDSGSLETCDSTDLSPQLAKIPCDPQTKQPYLYLPAGSPPCGGYRLCATLKNLGDPDIIRIGCDPVEGCGWGAGYNYCLASGVSVVADGFIPGGGGTSGTGGAGGAGTSGTGGAGGTPTPTPWPSGGPTGGNLVACTTGGVCNSFADPEGRGCPVWWSDNCPVGACTVVANRCP